jgi:hypothetical protein
MSCFRNPSISAVSPRLALVGAHSPVIATVDLQSDRYLQHSVIQLLVNICGSCVVKYASKISASVPHYSWVYSNSIWYRSPVVFYVRKLPIRYCNLAKP